MHACPQPDTRQPLNSALKRKDGAVIHLQWDMLCQRTLLPPQLTGRSLVPDGLQNVHEENVRPRKSARGPRLFRSSLGHVISLPRT